MSQAGYGTNGLAIQQAWPADSVRFYLAMPSLFWKRYAAKLAQRGFEVVKEPVEKPFPDAVILRQTHPRGARLEFLDHAHERFFGMALGLEIDVERLGRAKGRPGDIALVHTMRDGTVAGGFTLRPTTSS
jgi:hypothetical protein